jgi:alcohol dehydrogenase class IV
MEISRRIRTLGGKSTLWARVEASSIPAFSIRLSNNSIVFASLSRTIVDNVHEGLDRDKENGSDLTVSRGGGRAHDCSKRIGIVATNGGRISDDEGGQ